MSKKYLNTKDRINSYIHFADWWPALRLTTHRYTQNFLHHNQLSLDWLSLPVISIDYLGGSAG